MLLLLLVGASAAGPPPTCAFQGSGAFQASAFQTCDVTTGGKPGLRRTFRIPAMEIIEDEDELVLTIVLSDVQPFG